MINDPGFRKALARMSGIECRVSGNPVADYDLIYVFKKKLRNNRGRDGPLSR